MRGSFLLLLLAHAITVSHEETTQATNHVTEDHDATSAEHHAYTHEAPSLPPEAHPAVTEGHLAITDAHPATTEAHHAVDDTHPATTEAHHAVDDTHPATTLAYPAVTGVHPAVTDTHPDSTDAHPDSTDAHPAATEAHPAATEAHPAATEAHPAATEAHPVVTKGLAKQPTVKPGKVHTVPLSEPGINVTTSSIENKLVIICKSEWGPQTITYELFQGGKKIDEQTIQNGESANFLIEPTPELLHCLAKTATGELKASRDLKIDGTSTTKGAERTEEEERDSGYKYYVPAYVLTSLSKDAQRNNALIIMVCGPTLLLILILCALISCLRYRRQVKARVRTVRCAAVTGIWENPDWESWSPKDQSGVCSVNM